VSPTGLASGEGLIHRVRDPAWHTVKGKLELADAGIEDKRLLIVETEFGGVLDVMSRPGNILSAVVRQASDHGTLTNLSKTGGEKATGAHVSILGHVTGAELLRKLTDTDAANGFGNRFLFAHVRRSKLLPEGGSLAEADIEAMGRTVARAVGRAKDIERLKWTEDARHLWRCIYMELAVKHGGLWGSLTNRGEAIVTRLALVEALTDASELIDVPHLRAALAIWNYGDASVARIFGRRLGDAVADSILRALKLAGPDGRTRTEISGVFQRNVSSARIDDALALLRKQGLAKMRVVPSGGGRSIETWTDLGN